MLIPIAFSKKLEFTKMPITVLAGDVGGSKTYLALFSMENNNAHVIKEEKYISKDFNDLSDIIDLFLIDQQTPEVISIGVAGPVQNGKVKITNLSWELDRKKIQQQTGVKAVQLINDLEATAYGLTGISMDDIATVHGGDNNSSGNIAIIAPGTGLGEAGLYWDGQHYHPFATEGGHCDFAPRTELDMDLYRYLQLKFGHVSWVRLVSGPGIYHIYQFLRDEKKREEPKWLAQKIISDDPSITISQSAISGKSEICNETMLMFIRYLAEESANLVLKLKATGGLFIGGGIAPRIKNLLKEEIFLTYFCHSGRLNPLLEKVPLKIILEDKAALIGAAYFGAYSEVCE